jgi:hypothetical protein
MVPIECPTCKGRIKLKDINLRGNVAFCHACDAAYALSALAGTAAGTTSEDLSAVDLNTPPPGAWLQDVGGEFVVGASMRSLKGAFATFFLAAFWNGIVSVFVLVAISGAWHHLFGRVPAWLPAPKSGGTMMGAGMVVFLWIFLVPFLLVGAGLIAAFLATLGGRVEIRVREGEGVRRFGFGPFSRSKRFDASRITAVTLEHKRWRDSDGDNRSNRNIIIHADTPITFGSMLPDDRQRFVAAALQRALAPERASAA